jgi:conjugative transfer signal peptidase TraF
VPWRDLARLAAVLGGLAAAAAVWYRSGLILNHTASMPLGVYRVQRAGSAPRDGTVAPPARGSTVVWCLPARLAAEARRRGYLVRGRCPGEAEPVLKVVAAVPGDTVVVDADGIGVNGRRLPNSRPLGRDARGRRLAAVPHGTYVVPTGIAWLWSQHDARSFDSRYYGGVPVGGLVGLTRPVWTARRSQGAADREP